MEVENNIDNQQDSGLSEKEQIEQEAIARFKESQQTQEEKEQGLPDGYNQDGTQKEELLAGKFTSQEELVKAYEELQKKLGQGSKEEQKPIEEPAKEVETPAGETFDVSSFEREYVENGSLSEDSYKALAEKGFSKQQVDQYISGQQYFSESVTNRLYDSVGGQDKYTEMVQWASENMEASFIEEYNNSLKDLDEAKISRNIEYMQLKFQSSQPKDTRRIEGDGAGGGLQPYKDKNEWQRAATNRLYGKDAKYTNLVDMRYLAARKKGIL